MDPEGKIPDERAGIAEPFVFAPSVRIFWNSGSRSGRNLLGSGNGE